MMDKKPDGLRIESAEIVGYRDYFDGGIIEIIRYIGVDKDNYRWRWIGEHLTTFTPGGASVGRHYQDYGYTRI